MCVCAGVALGSHLNSQGQKPTFPLERMPPSTYTCLWLNEDGKKRGGGGKARECAMFGRVIAAKEGGRERKAEFGGEKRLMLDPSHGSEQLPHKVA